MAASNPKSDHLSVPGASLYYETRGEGPLLLLIAGANGDATIFQQIAAPLSEHFTVVAYDRRGFSRSELQEPQNYETRLATDADDARRLIEHLSKTPAIVFGSSSGAVVALTLLIRHSSAVRALIAHEPPAVNLLADAEALQWRTFFNDVYDVYREEGVKNGMQKFVAGVLTREEAEHLRARSSSGDAPERSAANIQYWFEHEVRQYTSADLDVGVLKNSADRLILAAGDASRDCFPYRPNKALSETLGLDILELPGGHLGYASHASRFAEVLLGALDSKGFR